MPCRVLDGAPAGETLASERDEYRHVDRVDGEDEPEPLHDEVKPAAGNGHPADGRGFEANEFPRFLEAGEGRAIRSRVAPHRARPETLSD